MATFRNKKELRDRAIGHFIADDYIRGKYADIKSDGTFTGCAVGCLANPVGISFENAIQRSSNQFEHLSETYGIEKRLLDLVDDFFERVAEYPETWPIRFVEALPEGVEITSDSIEKWIDKNCDHNFEYVDGADWKLLNWLAKKGRKQNAVRH